MLAMALHPLASLGLALLLGQTAASPRLRIMSNCSFPIWIQQQYGAHGLPIPGNRNALRLDQGGNETYDIPDAGLAGSRFWGKTGCDETGYNCAMGDQVPNPHTGQCPPQGCTPPVDTLFEATWGCTLADPGGCAVNPSAPSTRLGRTTYFDTSQVDGYTLSYKLVFHGDTAHCDCDPKTGACKGTKEVDAGGLDLGRCPTDDDLSGGGKYPNWTETDLRLKDANGTVRACMSPCKRLSTGQPYGPGISESVDPALHMCCPTPVVGAGCTPAAGCMTPAACRSTTDPASVTRTKYVHAIHDMAPGIYAYTYDDGDGLHGCPGSVTYDLIFCPNGSPPGPAPGPGPSPGPGPAPHPSPSPTPSPPACAACSPDECKQEHCGRKTAPFVCTKGQAAGGCAGSASTWVKSTACDACCDSSSCP